MSNEIYYSANTFMTGSQHAQLQSFFNQSRLEELGAVITDLDGTAVHEYLGHLSIPQSVELGLNSFFPVISKKM